jgi:hypothetical protein
MDANTEIGTGPGESESKAFMAPTLTFVGLVTEIVQSAGGKSSNPLPDGPDIRKPPGQPG